MKDRKQLIEQIMDGLHAIRNQIKSRAIQLEHKNGITHSQWFVLMILEHYKKNYKKMSIKELAEKLEVSSSAATQLVDGLVKNGYVLRKENPEDRRLVKLELSPRGKKHLTATKEKRILEMAGLFDSLTDNELNKFLRLQNKILSKSHQIHKKSGGEKK